MRKLNIHLFMMACALLTLTTMASCLDDNNEEEKSSINLHLTEADRSKMIHTAAGAYEGVLYYQDRETQDNKTTGLAYTLQTDSTFTIGEFPVSLLANYVSDAVAREALEAVPDQTFKGEANTYYIADDIYCFTVVPDGPLTCTGTVDGQSHDITVAFAPYITVGTNGVTSYVYPVAQYYPEEGYGYLMGNILIGSITVDGRRFDVNKSILYSGKKKL